jgi:hypothetical protein
MWAGPVTGHCEAPGWMLVHCRVGGSISYSDAFLIRMAGPLMARLVDIGEVAEWFFDRPTPRTAGIYARDADPALLLARLTGLTSALGRAGARRTGAGIPIAVGPVATPPRTSLRCGSAQLALEVIAATPTRAARLGAALDLAIVTAMEFVVGGTDPVRWSMRWPAAIPGHPDEWLVGAVARRARAGLGAADDRPVSRGDRWTVVRDVVRAGRGPLARWAGQLSASKAVESSPAAARCHALRHLHNQLGISARDERFIFASLSQSLAGREIGHIGVLAGARRRGQRLLAASTPGGTEPSGATPCRGRWQSTAL